jgi:hypothetical protein
MLQCAALLFAAMEQLSFGFTQEEFAEDEVHQKPYCSLRVIVMQRISECDALFFFGAEQNPTAVRIPGAACSYKHASCKY